MKMLFLFLLSLNATAACFPVTTKIIFSGKEEKEKSVLCEKKTADHMLFYTSESCDGDKCEILKRAPKKIVIKNYKANIGSPGFKLCEELGGVPQIFEFQKLNVKEWQSTERCFFGKKDFVEISLLTHEWKSFVQAK
jgi:hypothetical protein